ncbi:hypothetical protein YPBV_gp44 [Yersinia phage Berlin]|uniref:Uncharacterized protein n=1 Tax=Yersinia phage Berlin TaxID=369257 RepID=A0ZXG1_9CAUD|nr:hypothetical protein YPBV_gp44 [Yersinia phage Berlin]CAJ70695.1 hypothetical protein [Yersinia phage Berlin]
MHPLRILQKNLSEYLIVHTKCFPPMASLCSPQREHPYGDFRFTLGVLEVYLRCTLGVLNA